MKEDMVYEHQSPKVYNTFEDFVRHHRDTIFRYWIYRRMFTPDEQSNKYTDESMFEDSFCTTGYIQECIKLPDGDILLGLVSSEDVDLEVTQHVQYCKLSEIRLERYDGDQYEQN